MTVFLSSILPVFLVIALGYAAVRTRLFPATALSALGTFVLKISVPVMFFRSLSQHSFAEVMNSRFLATYAIGSLALFAFGLLWSRWLRKQPLERAAIVAMGMSCANSAYVGYPVALQVVGPIATTLLAMIALIENVVMIPLSLAVADSAGATHEPFLRALVRAQSRLLSNPLVIGILLGVLFALLHVHLPAPAARALDLLGATSAPIALFYIGGNLVGLALGEVLLDVQAISYAKLVLHPLAVGALMLAMGPTDPSMRAGAIVFASAPMLSIYPIFGARHGLQGLCAAALLLATVLAFLTMSTFAWLVGTMSPVASLLR